MSYLLDPPRPIEVRVGDDRTPRHLSSDPLVGELRVVQSWIADLDWWSEPVSREYWKVILQDRLLCDIFWDRIERGWFLERVYD
jgi:hypothetical protein